MSRAESRERRLAVSLMTPALGTVLVVAIFPLLWTLWESLHAHDLRMPWLGRPFVGAANYLTLAEDARFWGEMHDRIEAKRAGLYGDLECVRALEAFLARALSPA